jgi:S1-C subfamily serine protease
VEEAAMRPLAARLFVFVLAVPLNTQAADDSSIRKTVVRVFSETRAPSLSSPWKRSSTRTISGSGIWIGDQRVLTNAHMILYSSQISVQPYQSTEKIPAKVVAEAPEMDLAIVEVEGADTFPAAEPPSWISGIPEVRTTVQVYGYPTGGASQSVTEGIISRIEYAAYSYGEGGLRIQVDAALNAGNSGGPAIVDNEIVGIVYSRLRESDNIGYLIPSEEVRAFRDDIEDGQYDGKPRLFDVVQKLLNQALRSKLGLDRTTTGVLVRTPYVEAPDYPLKPGDIITRIGDRDIDNTGMVRLSENVRVHYRYLVSQFTRDGRVPLTILRGGQERQIEAPVQYERRRLIPHLKGRYPSYFVYGPIAFVEATAEFLEGVEKTAASSNVRNRVAAMALSRLMAERRSPLLQRRFEPPEFDGEQLVMVCSGLLPHRISIGYNSPQTQVLKSVNGQVIRNLRHLVETLRDLDEPNVVFEFADRYVETLVFDRQEILSSMDDILADNSIARQGSPDVMAIWRKPQTD